MNVPPKLMKKTRRKLILQSAKRPIATLKECQEFLASMVMYTACDNNLPYSSYVWTVRCGKTEVFSFKKNIQTQLHFAKNHIMSDKSMWRMYYGMIRQA